MEVPDMETFFIAWHVLASVWSSGWDGREGDSPQCLRFGLKISIAQKRALSDTIVMNNSLMMSDSEAHRT